MESNKKYLVITRENAPEWMLRFWEYVETEEGNKAWEAHKEYLTSKLMEEIRDNFIPQIPPFIK